jgi:uncharacterized caspase-like protein
MSNSLSDLKRRTLQKRLAGIYEEYEAASAQLNHALSNVNRLRIQRQIADLERQIQEVESELGQLAASKAPIEEQSKAQVGALSLVSQELYTAGEQWVVLVGVNHYTDPFYPPLHVCVKDAEAIYKQLTAGGFDSARIHLFTDNTDPLPTRAKILASLQQAAKAARRDDLILFYYSGHGDKAGDTSYLVARDGEAPALKYTAIALPEVAEVLRDSQARAKVIVVDACHSGANFEGKGPKPMPPGFIKRVFEQAKGEIILASCEQGELSHEWQAQERSAFTHFLLEALEGKADRDEKGFVTIQDINRYVSNGVRKWAFEHKRSQTPTLQGAMAGDIILARYEVEE